VIDLASLEQDRQAMGDDRAEGGTGRQKGVIPG
jgi:hypothetical protein